MKIFEFKNPNIASHSLDILDVRSKPFEIYGLYQPLETGKFRRIPEKIAKNTSERVMSFSTNTAGGRIRFKTDSPIIAIGAIYPPMKFLAPRSTALSSVGAYCFDMYADGKFVSALLPETIKQNGSVNNFEITNGQFEACYNFEEQEIRDITINFPSIVDISDVFIGVCKGCILEKGSDYINKEPVVFYGSSITQGACASRPGNTYENILSRKLNMDYVNLGFSGSAKAEKPLIEYISTIKMHSFVFDYDHNAPSPDFLEQTHFPALQIFREAQPNTPIILMSRPNRRTGIVDTQKRLDIIYNSYKKLIAAGDNNVYFINGQDILNSLDSEIFTIDGVHPNDFGFYCMAVAVEDVLKNIL